MLVAVSIAIAFVAMAIGKAISWFDGRRDRQRRASDIDITPALNRAEDWGN